MPPPGKGAPVVPKASEAAQPQEPPKKKRHRSKPGISAREQQDQLRREFGEQQRADDEADYGGVNPHSQ